MKNIAIVYFSGTGNTRYLAHRLRHQFETEQVVIANITKDYDFSEIIKNSDFVFVCYPVYGSTAPMIMENFVYKYQADFKGKDVGVLITEGGFCGDGAMYLGRILKKLGANVCTTEHFIMPDNLYDVASKPYSKEEISKLLSKVGKKMDIFVERFNKGNFVKRGSDPFSRFLGGFQRVPWKKFYPKIVDRLTINTDKCIGCSWCVDNCPTGNLSLVNNKATKSDKCTLCYRCVNGCPKKAISIFGKETKFQYEGVNTNNKLGEN